MSDRRWMKRRMTMSRMRDTNEATNVDVDDGWYGRSRLRVLRAVPRMMTVALDAPNRGTNDCAVVSVES